MSSRPTYKAEDPALLNQVPTATNVGNGAAPVSPHASAPPLIRSIEDEPRKGDTTASIVQAGNVLYRVVMAQIAYHEAEAKKLREVLRQFAVAAGKPDENVQGSLSADDMRFLRDISQNLGAEK